MNKGGLIIGFVWFLINLFSYLIFGEIGLLIANFGCILIIWFGRNIIYKLLNI